MKTLILSDIHANLPALQAVLNDAGVCDRLVFLGDLANFGPHPAECVELLRQYDPICIMGNHDQQIASECPGNFWDKWSRKMLTQEQLDWIGGFEESRVIDGHILAIHGIYTVPYDILPNTPDEEVEAAFRDIIMPGIDEVWFGHYHYQIDRVINGVTYRCIRPVGHHRDKDTRASYYGYEDGELRQKRVAYDLNKTIADFKCIDAFGDDERKQQFVDLLRNAYSEKLLKKDIAQMKANDTKMVN